MPVPVKPKIEMGVIDAPALEVITNKVKTNELTNSEALTYGALSKKIKAAGRVRVPIMDYDKAIAIKPKEWSSLEDYRGALEDYVRNHCH